MGYDRELATGKTTRTSELSDTPLTVGKQTRTEALPALPDISQSNVEEDALAWEDISSEENTREEPAGEGPDEDTKRQDDEDKLVGAAPRSNKGSVIIYDNEKVKLGKLVCRLKVELEHSQVVSGGVNREVETTPSIGLLSTERKADFTAAGKLIAGSVKAAALTGRIKFFEVLGLDLKVFEASQSTDKAKSLKELMTMAPSLDVVKLSGWVLASKVVQSPELKRLTDAGIDVRVKTEISVPLKSLLTQVELDDLKKLVTKVDEAVKRMDDLDKRVFDKVDDAAEELGERMKSSRFRKGALGKKNRLSKQDLRSLLKEIDALKLPKANSKMYQRIVRHVLGKRLGSLAARIAVKSFSKLTRLIPVVGWVMLAYDLLELGYLAYKVYDGSAKFGLGGSSVSLLDVFDSPPEVPEGATPTTSEGGGTTVGDVSDGAVTDDDAPDEQRKTELAKLDADQQKKLLATGTPLGRLMKGVATQMPEGEVKVHHLTRLIQIAESYQLTDAKVDEVLKLVMTTGPSGSPDKTLDMLDTILKRIAERAAVDRDGDGVPDGTGTGTGTGNGDGNGNGDGKGKGKGKGNGDGKGQGRRGRGNGDTQTIPAKRERPGRGDADADVDLPTADSDVVLDDPVGSGFVRVWMTSGGLTDPQILRDVFQTPSGAVAQIVEARFLGGHQKDVKNDNRSMTMEIRLELLIYTSKDKPPTKKVQSSSYGWFPERGIVRLRDSNLQGAIETAVRKKLTKGSMDGVTFDIIEQKRAQGGYSIKVKLTAVRGVLLRETPTGPERLEVGSEVETFVDDKDIK